MGCLWFAAACGLVAWAAQSQVSQACVAGAACALIAAGGIAWRGWLLSPQGVLAWDGEGWRWQVGREAEDGTPGPVLDLQHLLLLRWQAAGQAGRWLWAEKRSQPHSWDDLRRAVYSRAPGT